MLQKNINIASILQLTYAYETIKGASYRFRLTIPVVGYVKGVGYHRRDFIMEKLNSSHPVIRRTIHDQVINNVMYVHTPPQTGTCC